MTRAEIIAALRDALDSRRSALMIWAEVKPAVIAAVAELEKINKPDQPAAPAPKRAKHRRPK